jgi:hypothetical protein
MLIRAHFLAIAARAMRQVLLRLAPRHRQVVKSRFVVGVLWRSI